MERQNEELEIDLLGLLLYLKKKIWIIAASVALFAVIGYMVSAFFMTPQYTASTRMYVLNRSNEGQIVYSDFQVSTYVLNDYKGLITGRNVTKEVIDQLDLKDMSPSALASKIQVSSPESTRILQINVTDTDPQRAADIANTVREVAAEQIKTIMAVDAVTLVYEADVPTAPASPNVSKITLLAAAVGFALAAGVFAVIFLLDDTIRTEEDVEKRLGLSVVGVIPISEQLGPTGKSSKKSQPAARPQAEKNKGVR